MKVFVSSFVHVGLSSILLDFFIVVVIISTVLSSSFCGGAQTNTNITKVT